jgi:hypothetical protein
MTGKDAPPEVKIRSYRDSPICDVVVVVHGTEMVLRCPDYRQAMRWARLERKSYKIPEPDIEVAAKPNPASCHFSCVQIEIELSSARNERKTGAEGKGEMTGPYSAGLPWTRGEDDQLRAMLEAGMKAPAIALKLRRTV